MEISEEKLACQMLEITYNHKHGITDFKNINKIYPLDWFSNTNYIKKIEILNEALKNDVLIIKTKSYQDIIEGVRDTK